MCCKITSPNGLKYTQCRIKLLLALPSAWSNLWQGTGELESCIQILGMEFKANVSKHFSELWGVHKTYTKPYTPWSDGQVECTYRTIQQLLKVNCEERLHVWDEYIWCIMQAYNSTMQTSTGCTPFMLMHSRCENPDFPLDLL